MESSDGTTMHGVAFDQDCGLSLDLTEEPHDGVAGASALELDLTGEPRREPDGASELDLDLTETGGAPGAGPRELDLELTDSPRVSSEGEGAAGLAPTAAPELLVGPAPELELDLTAAPTIEDAAPAYDADGTSKEVGDSAASAFDVARVLDAAETPKMDREAETISLSSSGTPPPPERAVRRADGSGQARADGGRAPKRADSRGSHRSSCSAPGGVEVRKPSKASLLRRSGRLSFCLLAVRVSMPGRAFPVWKVAINAQNRLKDVLRRWASDHLGLEGGALPEGLKAFGGAGEGQLDTGQSLQVLRKLLPVQDGRIALTITLPAPPEAQGDGAERKRAGGMGSSGKGSLAKLRISTRYADVNRDSLGFHKSSTLQAKIDAGVYQWNGQYAQAPFIEAMRTPPEPKSSELILDSKELFVFPERSQASGQAPAKDPLFRATLRGPVELIANFEATCDRLAKLQSAQSSPLPFPVFIPTRGRAQRANLNWEADHVYGAYQEGSQPGGLFPVVCIVVEPHEEEDYRDAWPFALTLVLPESARGPGYARWVVQRVCSRAHLWLGKPKTPGASKWQVRRLPYAWIADDGLSMFYRLAALGPQSEQHQYISERNGAQRVKERQAPAGAPMFRDAFLTVQKHTFLPRAAVSGFLRDDGTAVCKKMDWKSDELSMYKIVLLNLGELRRLNVEYQRDLKMYEDICLTHQVLRGGGHTLKCQSFCYWASHSSAGGCAEQRQRRGQDGTSLDDLMSPSCLARIPSQQQQIVRDLHAWVRSKEQLSTAKSSAGPAGASSSSASAPPAAGAGAAAAARPKKEGAVGRPAGASRVGDGGRRQGRPLKEPTPRKKREPKPKKERDHRAEYQRRKQRRLEKEAQLRAERRAMGLPSSPEVEGGRKKRRRKAREDDASSDSDSSSSSSGSASSSSSSSGAADNPLQRFLADDSDGEGAAAAAD